jgi:ankyrin repeat protein
MTNQMDTCESFITNGRWDELEDLLDRQPQLARQVDRAGRTLLMICARFGGSAHTIQKLIEHGADPNHRALDNSNVLAAAICGGSNWGLTTIPELNKLLELGANPNSVADSGMPALHWAIAQNRLEHARVLLEHGADMDVVTSDVPPESAMDIAKRIKSEAAITILNKWK